MTIQERVNHYASSYSGILPKEVIESSKEWWRKELEGAAEEARREERERIVKWANENWIGMRQDEDGHPDDRMIDYDNLIAHLSDK